MLCLGAGKVVSPVIQEDNKVDDDSNIPTQVRSRSHTCPTPRAVRVILNGKLQSHDLHRVVVAI